MGLNDISHIRLVFLVIVHKNDLHEDVCLMYRHNELAVHDDQYHMLHYTEKKTDARHHLFELLSRFKLNLLRRNV